MAVNNLQTHLCLNKLVLETSDYTKFSPILVGLEGFGSSFPGFGWSNYRKLNVNQQSTILNLNHLQGKQYQKMGKGKSNLMDSPS